MKRFASHYLLIPAVAFMKKQVVEITGEGIVRDVFPLTEEIESVEWMPGVIALLSENQMEEIKNTGMIFKIFPVFSSNLPNHIQRDRRKTVFLYVCRKKSWP